MTQGVIAEWTKKEGEVIKAGDCMAKVETDSAWGPARARGSLGPLVSRAPQQHSLNPSAHGAPPPPPPPPPPQRPL